MKTSRRKIITLIIFTVCFLFVLMFSDSSSKAKAAVLERPIYHPNVIQLKKDLMNLGFSVQNTNFTDYFGPQTEKTVMEFQRYYGLNADGVVGSNTTKKINEVLSSPLQRGKRHKDTVQLKKDLAFLDMPVPGNGTNYYGVQTEKRVKEFQRKNNLIVNGIADPVTLTKIEELKSQPMSKGTYRQDVVQLKKDLSKIGFPVPGNGTTYFGPQTEKKVEAFQRYYGLSADGIVGSQTSKKIDEILSSPLQRGKRHQDTIQLKEDLAFLDLRVPGNGTNYYGVQTEKRIKELQRKNNLVVNGIVDPVTSAKIVELKGQPLSNGSYRQDVVQLKRDLGKIGFAVPGNGTTYFGPQTKKQVEAFQRYYGLSVDGVVGSKTSNKIEEILSSPLQRSKRHEDTIQLKIDLDTLGYFISANPTNLYGKKTEEQVRKFQNDQGLVGNGIADEITLAKIQELLPEEPEEPEKPEEPKEVVNYTEYNISLDQALNTQMSKLQQTDKYSGQPAYVAAEYVEIDTRGSGTINGNNVRLRSSTDLGDNDNVKHTVHNGTKIKIVDEVKGDSYNGSTKWYKIEYKNETLYVHSALADPNTNTGIVTASNLNIRSEKNTNSHIYGQLSKGTEVEILEKGETWYRINYGTWRNPTRADVKQYLDPSNNDRFQHLDLSSNVGVSASELNKVLNGRGVLDGQGQAFIDGAKEHKVNEIYLISHAILESGSGSSQLATGVEVGKNKSGKPVLVTDKNRKDLTDIKTTYNLFGIGAVDSNPLEGGAVRAYNLGWTSPKKAIIGGAKFVGESYIHHASHKQNTLYKMRWNPANPGTHQYATDIGWAVKQVRQIKGMYDQLDEPNLHFDIPVYK